MKKISSKFLAAFLAIIVIISAGFIFLAPRLLDSDVTYAEVYHNNKLIASFDLNRVNKSFIYDAGGGNTLLIEPGCISMIDADCPDLYCIMTGAISSPGIPIVCLPNRIVVTISTKNYGIDTLAG